MKSPKHDGVILVAFVFAIAMMAGSAAATSEDAAASNAAPAPDVTHIVAYSKDKAKGKSYDEHVKDMKVAASKGYYARALKSCKMAYRLKPSDNLGTQCGAMACRAKKKSDAQRFYNKSSKRGKNLIKQLCLGSGVELSE